MKAKFVSTIIFFLLALYVGFLTVLYSYEKSWINDQKRDILVSFHCIQDENHCDSKKNIEKKYFKEKPPEYPRYGFYPVDPVKPEKATLVVNTLDGVDVLSMSFKFMESQNSFVSAISIIFLFILIIFSFVFYLFYHKIKIINYSLATKNTRLKEIALTDNLTKCFNRHHLKQNVISYIEKSVAFKENVFFGFVDLDHFKTINDNFGHDIGDVILKDFAFELNRLLPSKNSPGLYRIGGEEFLFVLYKMTEEEVFQTIKGVYDHFEKKRFEGYNEPLGLSMGVTKVSKINDSESEILKRADSSLYQAKESGRNKMVWRLVNDDLE